jgi:hypothetical protein
MKTVLTLVLFCNYYALSIGSPKNENNNKSAVCLDLKYSYMVETELSANEFFEYFCDRLKDKYNWHKVSTVISDDELYTAIFNFNDNSEHPWMCEVKIKKVTDELNKMAVVMIIEPYLES